MLPSTDYDRIREILSDDRIFNKLTDDTGTKEFDLPEWFIYLMPEDRDGLIMCIPRSTTELEAHIAILPEATNKAIRYGRDGLRWAFTTTPFQKVTCMIPTINKRAYLYAKQLGFLDEGTNRMSFLKDGKLHDQHFVGITKEDFLCHH